MDAAEVERLKAEVMKPLETFEEFKGATTQTDVNPNYIRPKMFMMRLQKIMDEYAGGVTSQFTTSEGLLKRGLELLAFLKEDSGEAGRRRPPRADALLGERAPHVPGRGPRPFHPLPRGDPLAGLLLPLRQAQDGREELARVRQLPSQHHDRASGR